MTRETYISIRSQGDLGKLLAELHKDAISEGKSAVPPFPTYAIRFQQSFPVVFPDCTIFEVFDKFFEVITVIDKPRDGMIRLLKIE